MSVPALKVMYAYIFGNGNDFPGSFEVLCIMWFLLEILDR